MVTKNTLAKIALKGTDFEVLADSLTGPVAIAFGFEDQVSPAKAVAKFIKDTKKGAILGGALDGNLLSAKEAEALAKILQKKNFLQKSLVLSTHQLQASLDLSTQLWLNLQELWQQSEIKKLLKFCVEWSEPLANKLEVARSI